MGLKHEDIMDNARSCQSFDWVVKNRYWDSKLKLLALVNEQAGICKKKFNGTNYDEASCSYGLNSQPPMKRCPDRVPFPRAKESQLATA